MRGFKVAKGFENCNIKLPERQTKNAAGYDFYVANDILIKAHSVALIPTGVKAYMEDDEVLNLYIRSSMPLKRGLTLANNVGIIDSDYYENPSNDGHIMIQVLNFSDYDVMIAKDERIAQGVFTKYLLADNDETKEIRNGGFGSTK